MADTTQNPDIALRPLAAAVFLIFFNGFMLAPLIPGLAQEFHVTIQQMGLIVPAYLLTYGASTLIYGPLSDRVGRKSVFLTLLALYTLVTISLAFTRGYSMLIGLRVLSGLCAGGILPIILALIADIYPYKSVGRPLGWMFGAVAGGSAFGSTFGAWLNPYIGWRNEFLLLALCNAIVFTQVWRQRRVFENPPKVVQTFIETLRTYVRLATSSRGSKTFGLIFLNGMFHSGIFSWLGYYLVQRYQLSDTGIGTALLGYGVPGMLLGPTIGKMADSFGRRKIIPVGFILASVCAFLLAPTQPLWTAAIIITALSIGFDMSHPLMAGIVTSIDPQRRGQTMGLNAFAIFTGYGLGALVFQLLLPHGMAFALLSFAFAQILLGLAATRAFAHD